MIRRIVIPIAAVAALVAIYLTTSAKVRKITDAATVDGVTLDCAAMVVAMAPPPQTPTPDQVAAACNETGKTFNFTAVPGQFPAPAGAFVAVVVHKEPVKGVLVGFYPTGDGKACELDTSRVVHIVGLHPASPADLTPGDQLLWLVRR